MQKCDTPALNVVRRMLKAPVGDWYSAKIQQVNGAEVIFHGSVKNRNFPLEPDFVSGVDLFDLRDDLSGEEFALLLQKMQMHEIETRLSN
tara:strand:- start:661 stop:930 length:270 start_codon:yes stop_codon:yes gene_type:complete